MLPAHGPWPHPYYRVPDSFVEVAFDDEQGHARRVRVRHKTLGEGPPLVLVHGLMTSSYSWRYVMEPLSQRYRVLVPDLVGSGATDKPLDLVYSVANVARFLAAWVRAVAKEPVYLVGNSLGGLYSIRALLDSAAGPQPLARRFVLMHAPGYPFARTRALNVLLGAPGLAAGLASLVARVCHRWPRQFVARNVHYARKDVMVPASFGPLYLADIPASELVWMDDASHFLQVDAPERTIEQIVSFDAEARAA